MGKYPKAIFLDMDGTILNHHNEVSIHTKEVIDDLRKQGIYIFVATGRAAGEIKQLAPAGFEVDGIITSNGMIGHIKDEELYKHSLPVELTERVIEKAREHQIFYELFPYGQKRIALQEDENYMRKEISEPKPEGVGINEWLSRKQAVEEDIEWTQRIQGSEFSKFYCFARTRAHIDRWKKELEILKEEIPFSTSISSPFNVEIMVADVNKATGIKEMLKYYQLKQNETLAIGDSNNDLPMFAFVNHAVAMQNASAEVQKTADEVTEFSCDEDGVYHYLKKILMSVSR